MLIEALLLASDTLAVRTFNRACRRLSEFYELAFLRIGLWESILDHGERFAEGKRGLGDAVFGLM